MRLLFTALSVLMLGIGAVCAQSLHTTDAASDYDRGYAMYCDGNYAGCFDIMSSLLHRSDAAQYHEESAFYAAMSQAQHAVMRTPELLNRYLLEYPFSIHKDEVILALGYYYYDVNEYEKAIEELLKLNLSSIDYSEQDDYCHRLAMSHLYTNHTDKAHVLFQALAQNSVQYRDKSRYYSGYIYYEKGDYVAAHRELMLVHSSSEYYYESQYLLLNIDFANKQYAQCVSLCQQLFDAKQCDKYQEDLYRIAGESHYQLGNDIQALECINRYMTQTTAPYRTTLYMAGILTYRDKQYSRAIELLDGVADVADEISQCAYLHKGLAYLQLKDLNKAYMAFTHAAESRCDETMREKALYNQALCAYESNLNLFDSTLSLFENFLREYPHSSYADDINSRISDLYLSSRNYKVALDYIDRIKDPSREILKQRQQILYILGTESFANNRIADAANLFSQAVKVGNYAPEYRVRSIYWLGECCYRKEAYKEALKCYEQVVNSNITTDATTVALAQYNIAYCHLMMKKYGTAGTAFEVYTKQKGTTTPLLVDAYTRMGDCSFQTKNYATAEKHYAKAAEYNSNGSDYALLQQAVVVGVNKDYNKKVKLLKQHLEKYPKSEYSNEVYNELGLTYISLNNNREAIKAFNQLVEKYPKSTLARSAMLQLGALYYNQNELQNSIDAYKKLIEQHPTSSEAKVAIEDIKSIYIELDRVDELLSFMQQQGVGYEKNELDSLTYIAAERSYMTNGDASSLKKYTIQYPQGQYTATAFYYMGNVADAEQKYEEALSYYLNSLQANPHSNFSEEALARSGDILYDMERYARAANQYAQLEQQATTAELRHNARLALMRCYVATEQHTEAIATAARILAHNGVSPEVELEVRYYRAQSYRAQGEVESAMADLNFLSQDTRTLYGAEAAYIIAQYYFDSNRLDDAEQAAQDFVQKGTSHAYWLARNFILLADIYAAKNDNYTARQYLMQLRDNYPGGNDDIVALIEKRLENL